ncbi:Uncharacterised protein [Mycobacteroides abscessus subsp. abscessus]|nr:Uncharacterised protein [Mycobacteroides abscessus subsp. abscessus]
MFDDFKKITVDCEALNEIVYPINEPFILNINLQNTSFEFVVRIKEHSKKLIVFGSGAYDSKKFSPPVFQRHSWIKYIEENVIFYNDPTLYLGEINIGWGFGNQDHHYLSEIAKIISELSKQFDIQSKDTLFYGSSAGGFMSLILAGLIKGSKALVNNPQTIVTNYYAGHVNRLFSSVLPNLKRIEIEERYSTRINLLEFYKKLGYIPKIYYLQNLACEHDIKYHMNPFLSGLSDINPYLEERNIHLDLYYDKEKGHNPLDMDVTLEYLIKVSNGDLF